jgi:hypothetical protein
VNDCSPEIEAPVEAALQGPSHVPNPLTLVVRPMSIDRSVQASGTGVQTDRIVWNVAGYGSKRLNTDCGDNVGKGQLPAGADRNLQRPSV